MNPTRWGVALTLLLLLAPVAAVTALSTPAGGAGALSVPAPHLRSAVGPSTISGPPGAPRADSLSASQTVDLQENRVQTGVVVTRHVNLVGGIAFDPTDQLTFVAGSESNSIGVLSSSGTVVQTVEGLLPTGSPTAVAGTPGAMAFDTVDDRLFVADTALSAVEIYNYTSANATVWLSQSVALSSGANPVAVLALSSPDRVFVAEKSADTVVAIDGATGALLGNASTGAGPDALAYDPVGGEVYVANSVSPVSVTSFSPTSLTEGGTTFTVYGFPTSLAIDPTDEFLWVGASTTLTFINLTSSTGAGTLNLPGGALNGLAWDSNVGAMVLSGFPSQGATVNRSGLATSLNLGGSPGAVVVNPTTGSIEVLDPLGNLVDWISDASDTLSARTALGIEPGAGAFNPATDRLEIPDVSGDELLEVSVKAIDHGTAPIARAEALPGHPVAVTFDNLAGTVVVLLSDGELLAFNATSGATVATSTITGLSSAYALDYADGELFATAGSNSLIVIDARTLARITPISLPLNSAPRGMAYDPTQHWLFVALNGLTEFAVVNASTNTLRTTYAAGSGGSGATGLAYDPLNGNLFVSNPSTAQIEVFNPQGGAQLGTVSVGIQPTALTYIQSADEVIATATRSNAADLVSASTYSFIGSVAVGEYPGSLVYANVTGDLYVGNGPDSTLSVVPIGSPGGAPFSASLSVSPTMTDEGATIVYTVSVSAPTWDFTYLYGPLPQGCATVNSSALTCSPTQSGANLNTSVTVTSSGGDQLTISNTNLTIAPDPTVAPLSLSRAEVTVGISTVFTATVTGGVGPFQYTYLGLPPGCPGASTAQLTCAPKAAGDYNLQVTVKDSIGYSQTSNAVVLIVNNPTQVVPSVSVSELTVGNTVTIAANVSSGTGPFSFNYSGLPAGCASQNASALKCTPSAAGNFTVTVEVTDASGFVARGTVHLQVDPVPHGAGASNPVVLYALIGVVVIAVLAVTRRRSPPKEAGPEVDTAAVYTRKSRELPETEVGLTDAHAPESEAQVPQYFEGGVEAAPPSEAVEGGTEGRANIICPSCGAENEPWITNCRRCRRPIRVT